MSEQILLQGKILGIEPFLVSAGPRGPADEQLFAGRSQWLSLISEVLDSSEPEEYDYEGREPTLKLDISDLQVHEVKGIEFQTEPHSVHRHRAEKGKTAF